MRRPRVLDAELLVALAVVAFGIAVAIIGSRYSIGTIRNIGPGFFPVSLGVLVAAFGAILAVGCMLQPQPGARGRGPFPWRAVIMILVSVVVWNLLVERLGLAPATFALAIVASLSESPMRLGTAIVSGAVLALGASVVFVWLLKLPLPVFNW